MPSQTLTIFLSYASEDEPFAVAIGQRLSDIFKASVHVKYMQKFSLGLNWAELIDESADSADILLIITTGRQKPSHSYTGYEIGYFRRSQVVRPYIDEEKKIQRLIIPFVIYTGMPPAAALFQGLTIDRNRFEYNAEAMRKIDDSDPFYRLLERINEISNELSEHRPSLKDQQRTLEQFLDQATSFYRDVSDFMRSLPESTEFPKPRLTIYLPKDLTAKDIKIDDNFLLSCSGPTAGIFAQDQSKSPVPWTDFSKRIGGSDQIALVWNDALRSLVTLTLEGNFADTGHFVFSFDEKKLFRLFLSESRKYPGGTRQLDMYLVEILHDKDVGDPRTTFLAKAIAIAMLYRSLFLEKGSPYNHSAIALLRSEKEKWKPTINELLQDLRLLYARSREAGMFEAKFITEVFGDDPKIIGNINRMKEEFFEQWDQLHKAAAEVVTVSEPTHSKFDAFAETLDYFRTKTKERDTPFLAMILEHLKRAVELRSGAINLELAGDIEGPTEILLDDEKVDKTNARRAALINLSSGQHAVEVRGTKGGKQVWAKEVVSVEPGKITQLTLTVH